MVIEIDDKFSTISRVYIGWFRAECVVAGSQKTVYFFKNGDEIYITHIGEKNVT